MDSLKLIDQIESKFMANLDNLHSKINLYKRKEEKLQNELGFIKIVKKSANNQKNIDITNKIDTRRENTLKKELINVEKNKKKLENQVISLKSINNRPYKPQVIRPNKPQVIRSKKTLTKKKCQSDKLKNPKTFRCVKKKGKIGKKILKGKILNPATNRYVLKKGKIGKKISKTELKVIEKEIPLPVVNVLNEEEELKKVRDENIRRRQSFNNLKNYDKKKCPSDKIKNPKTSRCVKKNGRLARSIRVSASGKIVFDNNITGCDSTVETCYTKYSSYKYKKNRDRHVPRNEKIDKYENIIREADEKINKLSKIV